MMKKAIAIVGVALVCGAGSVHAEGFSAGPKVGVFLPEHGESSVLYGVEAKKTVAPRFTLGISAVLGELTIKSADHYVVLVPQDPVVIDVPPITVQPEPIKVDGRKPMPACGKPITVQPEPIVYQPEPKEEVRTRTVKRRSDLVLVMAQGAYQVLGPIVLKGGLGVASIDGDETVAVSAGAGVAVPVSKRVEASASVDYLHMDAADGVMLSAGLQYRF